MNREAKTDEPCESNFGEIATLAAKLNELLHKAAQGLAPEVERIIHADLRDEQEIEHALDRLLDCACTPEGLALFKSLCRHYYSFNPRAAAEYVNIYREMWDAEGDA